MANPLMLDNVWLQQQKFEDAERLYQQLRAGTSSVQQTASSSLASEIAQVRQGIHKALNKEPSGNAGGESLSAVYKRLEAVEKDNKDLRKIVDELRALVLNKQSSAPQQSSAPASNATKAPAAAAAASANDDDDDDDIDLFGSDDEEETAEAERLKQKRLKEYAEKKAKKPAVVAKSNIILDVKPYGDETDMVEMERLVRTIVMDGLLWGASKLVPVGYGINKLQISCVVEDDKVSVDDLTDKIQDDFEDHVQSVDIAAFNKV